MTPPPASFSAPVREKASQGTYLCHCLKITPDQVQDSVGLHGCETVDEVTACCGAGGGCTACHHKIRSLLRRK